MRRLIISFAICLLSTLSMAAATDGTSLGSALGLPSARQTPPPAAAAPPPQPLPPPAAAVVSPQPAPLFDYSVNLTSDVFGANLFTGAFARPGAAQFNPDYAVAIGDQIQVRMWGAYDFDATLTVDPQGNLFLPHTGPVNVLGVRNQDLQKVVQEAVRRTFRTNVFSYANLAAAQPVRVFVGGNVHRPGLYHGTSMDSLLHYLDQAGGIDPNRGSFLDVQVNRGGYLRANINFYEFLLEGRMPLVQLADGDVIFVTQRRNTVKVTGLAENAKRFEFTAASISVDELVRWAKPLAVATHVRVVRNTGTIRNVEYFSISESGRIHLENGDEIEFTSDKKPGTITVRVEGEHLSAQEYVLPHGARLGQLLQHIQFTERSDRESIQLFRLSVRERQRVMLQSVLKNLEVAVLTARSATTEEAQLRKAEADLILQWVERAKAIEPTGQVMIAQAKSRDDLLLENGDILRIPTRDGLVLISGEVLFPNTIAFEPNLKLENYIDLCGGFSQRADTSRVIIARRDGSFEDSRNSTTIRAGDEIMVLPRVQTKSLEITRAITQIIYQIAISTKVLVGL